MTTVFHVISHFDLGGAERVAINIAKSKNEDFKYHLVEVARGNSDFTQKVLKELQSENITSHRSPCYSKKIGILLFPLWFIFLYFKYRPNIIHSHTEIPDLSVYLFHFLVSSKVKYIRTIHNTQLWNNWGKIGGKVESFFIKNNSNIAISSATKECYKEKYNIEELPIIFNGVEQPNKQLKFDGLKKGKFNILFAGRFEYQKGIKELIQIINMLSEKDQFHFHIVGEGSMQVEVQTELKGNNFTLYKKIYNLSAYLGSFDFVFMPSNFEGLGLVSVEASLSKTPTIINSCLGLEETLPQDWPLKVKDNSVDEYINIFTNQLPTINYQDIANKAYDYAVDLFSISAMRKIYEQKYLEQIR